VKGKPRVNTYGAVNLWVMMIMYYSSIINCFRCHDVMLILLNYKWQRWICQHTKTSNCNE